MARPKEVVDIQLAEKAQASLKDFPDHKVCLRLQAIVSSSRYPISQVSEIFGTSRQTVWRWIKRFKAQGVDGLYDHPKGHKPAKLRAEHREEIAGWLEHGRTRQGEPVHWTLSKLALAVESTFGIKIGQTALWRFVHELGFRQKVPRPTHTKADTEVQEAFKKNS